LEHDLHGVLIQSVFVEGESVQLMMFLLFGRGWLDLLLGFLLLLF
jgi:hypothetical protein